MLPNDLQDLGDVDIDTFSIPPLLFAVVAGKEQHLGAVRQDVFNFNYVRLFALGAVHLGPSLAGDQVTVEERLGEDVLFQELSDIATSALSILGPVGVPVGTVGTLGTSDLPATN